MKSNHDIDLILQTALEISDLNRRSEYVKNACEGDVAKMREIERLIVYANSTQNWLDRPKVISLEEFVEGVAADAQVPVLIEQFGKYQIVSQLGKGGMGVVFKARDPALSRDVAIKIQQPSAYLPSEHRQRFLNEVRAAARLEHPNVVRVYEFNETHDPPFLVMELVDGRTLAEIVEQDGPIDLAEASRLIVEAAEGIAAAHAQGIVHRDIKPKNIMLNREGRVQILDLGVAKQHFSVSGDETAPFGLTREGDLVGTIDYISPEQVKNASLADLRSDIYSLGCTLYYLVEGNPPFTGTRMERIVAHREQPAPRLSQKPGADDDLRWRIDAVIQRMLKKDPSERQESMQEVSDELRQAVAVNINAASQRTKWRVGIAAAASIALLLLLMAWMWRTPNEKISFTGIVDPNEIELLLKMHANIDNSNKWTPEYISAASLVADLILSEPATTSFKELMKSGDHNGLNNFNKAIWVLHQRLDGKVPEAWRRASKSALQQLVVDELKRQSELERDEGLLKQLKREEVSSVLRHWNVSEPPPSSHSERQRRWIASFSKAIEQDVIPVANLYNQINSANDIAFSTDGNTQVRLRTKRSDIKYRGRASTALYSVWIKTPLTSQKLILAQLPSSAKPASDTSNQSDDSRSLEEIDTGIRLSEVLYQSKEGSQDLMLAWSKAKVFLDREKFLLFLGQIGLPESFGIENELIHLGLQQNETPEFEASFDIVHQDLSNCTAKNGITIDVLRKPILEIQNADLSQVTSHLPEIWLSTKQYRGHSIEVKPSSGKQFFPCIFSIPDLPPIELVSSFDESWRLRFSGIPSVAVRTELAHRICKQSTDLAALAPFASISELHLDGNPAHFHGLMQVSTNTISSSSGRTMAVAFGISPSGRLTVSLDDNQRRDLAQLTKETPKLPTKLTKEEIEASARTALRQQANISGVINIANTELSDYGALVTFAARLGDWPELRLGPFLIRNLQEIPTVVQNACSQQSLQSAAHAQWANSTPHPRFGKCRTEIAGWAPQSSRAELRTQIMLGDIPLGLDVYERVLWGTAPSIEVYNKTTGEWLPSSDSNIAASLRSVIEPFCAVISNSIYGTLGLNAEVALDDRRGRDDWIRLSPPSVMLIANVHIPVLEAKLGVGGVKIGEHGISFSSIPITLERSFYFPNFTVSDPRVELNFEDVGLKLGISVTPPMLPIGSQFKPYSIGSAGGAKLAMSATELDTLSSQFKLGGISLRNLRWDNPWIHVLRSDIDIEGNLRRRIPGRNSRTADAIRQSFGANGKVVVLQSHELTNCRGEVMLQDGRFDRLQVSVNGELEIIGAAITEFNGDLGVVANEGLRLNGMIELANCRIDGLLMVDTKSTPISLHLQGNAALPVVGTVKVRGTAGLDFSDYDITAGGHKDLPFVFGTARIHYEFHKNPSAYHFHWWWTTPDGREVHYTMDGPSELDVDEKAMLAELEQVYQQSLDPKIVKPLNVSVVTLPPPSSNAPAVGASQNPSGGPSESFGGFSAQTSGALAPELGVPMPDLQTRIENDTLRLVVANSNTE